jgi:hypothetical protein
MSNHSHKTYFKPVRVIDKPFLKWLGTQPCIFDHQGCTQYQGVCGHHSLKCPFKGMGTKASDDHAYSVCDNLHDEIHDAGNEQTVLDKYGFEGCILEHSEKIYNEYKEMKR